MARPEEMAQNMMNKWVKMREDQDRAASGVVPLSRQKRPFLASACEHLHDAEYWRRQIIREVTKLISEIQNPGLGEHKIRDLNDEINKKFREMHHWNKRIKELDGPDYILMEKQQKVLNQQDDDALEGSGGYRYFGAAKNLPGVKELFAKQAAKVGRKKRRANQYPPTLTPDYYGWRDEEDGVLLELEQKATRQNVAAIMEERRKHPRPSNNNDDTEQWTNTLEAAQTVASNPSLSQQLLSQAVLERKKKELLERLTL